MTALDDAKTFLRMALASGPRPVATLQQEAANRGLSWITVKRAKKAVGIQSRKIDLMAGWEWSLTPFEEDRM
jgi:hypothetical protein